MTSGKTPDGGPDETRIAPMGEAETFGSGRYVVKQLIGEGAQKTVYLVHDTRVGRDCALSLLKTGLLQADELARLRREAQTMARLTHANIVTVHAISDEAEERPYIVSEYVSAGDLRDELREAGGPLPRRRALAIAKDICRALGAAHRNGVIHRDLKPANIWLTEDGSAKLGDFGIAQAIDRSRLTMPGTMMGTAAYMAPEQAQAKEVTARSDLYSLGCVLYEMLTGQPPFESDNPMTVVSQHIHAQPTPPSERGAELSEALERLVLRLLEKDPAARPASAEDVLAELEAIEATETASPAGGLGRFWARPAYRVAAAVVVLAAIGGGVAAAVLLSGGGDAGSVTYQEINYGYFWDDPPVATSAECGNEDLLVEKFIAEGPTDFTGGTTTGDIVDEKALITRTVLFSADGCRTGFFTLTSILRDKEFNQIYITDSTPLTATLSPDGVSYVLTGTMVETVTGGTGIYQGASGGGTCTLRVGGAGPGVQPAGEGDCVLQVTTESAARLQVPLGVGVGANPTEVAIFGSSLDLPTTVEVFVAYSNGGTEPMTGLLLRITPPEGTQILTVARSGDDFAGEEGERVWALPDLPPATDVETFLALDEPPPHRDVRTFQFTLTFLAADEAEVSLVVEIDGDGFEEPVRTEPVVLTVVQ